MIKSKTTPGVITSTVIITVIISLIIASIISSVSNPWGTTFFEALIAYPFISYIIARIVYYLFLIVEYLFHFESPEWTDGWTSNTMLLVGALWPITAISIPFLLLAILIGGIYHVLD